MGSWKSRTTTDLNDSRFVRRVVRQDAGAFEQLYDELSPVVYGHLLQVAPSPATAEKLLVETFYRAWSQVPAFTGNRSAFPQWLAGIANDVLEEQMSTGTAGDARAAESCGATARPSLIPLRGLDFRASRLQSRGLLASWKRLVRLALPASTRSTTRPARAGNTINSRDSTGAPLAIAPWDRVVRW